MKAASMFFKILNCVAAIVTLTLFFFSFVSVVTSDGAFTLTGFQLAFGSEQTLNGEQISLWKSAWYMFAFILSSLSLLFSALSFKIRGARYASLVTSLATAINLTVLFCAGSVTRFVDTRPLETVTSVSRELFFLPALLVAVTVTVDCPAVVGVPAIMPSLISVNPEGKPLALHVMLLPVASSVAV